MGRMIVLFALVVVPLGAALAQPVAVEVRAGVPLLVVDGQAVAPMLYRENYDYNSRDLALSHYVSLYKAGVRLFCFPMGIGLTSTHEQRVTAWQKWTDPVIDELVKTTGPDIRILLMVPTDIRRTWNKQWAEHNPGEMALWPPDMTPGDRASLSSLKARALVCEGLADLVKYVETQPYASQVLGYFLHGGGGEWLDYWDYSPAAEAGFRRWLTAKYGTDAELKKSWGQAEVSLQTASLPQWDRLHKGDVGLFLDPTRSRQVVDFYQFYHEDAAASAAAVCKTAKEACEGKRLVGLWGGYYFLPDWNPGDRGLFRRRQGAFETTVRDPNVDFFMSPYCYQERHPGGVFVPQFLSDSMRLHGKLAIVEEDSRTSLAATVDDAYNPAKSTSASAALGDSFGRSETIEESLAVLTRNFGAIYSRPGLGSSWFCLGSKGGWYEDPALLSTITKLKRLADRHCTSARDTPEIAVIVSNRSLWYQRLNDFTPEMTTRLLVEGLARLGAPCDLYLDSDLEDARFPFDRYKLFVFANTFHLSARQRTILKERVQTGGKTVLSLYASGYADDDSLSTAGVENVTGMRLEAAKISLVKGAHVVITDYLHPATQSVPRGTRYGTSMEFGPVLWCDDPEATPLGDLVATDASGGVFTLCKRGGLCVKRLAGWTSVWSAVPNLPPDLLRSIARMAGVHLYSDGNDAVNVGNGLLSLHAGYAGPRTIHLPHPSRITDALSGKCVAESAGEFTVDLPARATGLWEIE